MNGRLVAIIHRRKKTAQQEARPTLIAIQTGPKVTKYQLKDETDELDFLLGRYPLSWQKVEPTDDLAGIQPHHIKWKKTESRPSLPPHQQMLVGKQYYLADKIPASYGGIQAGDMVLSPLGGSGDRFIYAIAKQAGINVYRLPTHALKDERGPGKKDDDPELLLATWQTKPDLFRHVERRELQLIRINEAYHARDEAMVARIACNNRLIQRLVGATFLTDGGGYPEGNLEDLYESQKANDVILEALTAEEKAREKELRKLVENFSVYQEVLQGVEGCGPMIAARLIVAIGDIRRFPTEAKFRKYCGVHVADGGEFARKRTGQVWNSKAEARQAFYLLAADQFMRRKDSVWGQKLRTNKELLRQKHPVPINVNKDLIGPFRQMERELHRLGVEVIPIKEVKTTKDLEVYLVNRLATLPQGQATLGDILNNLPAKLTKESVVLYSPIHIQRMAIWRTASQFATWLYREWWKLEDRLTVDQDQDGSADSAVA